MSRRISVRLTDAQYRAMQCAFASWLEENDGLRLDKTGRKAVASAKKAMGKVNAAWESAAWKKPTDDARS